MGRLDIAFKDFLKQKHVLASLAEVMIFQSKGMIRPENVTILDTVQAKLDTKNRRNHKELIQDVVCRIDTIAGDRYICLRYMAYAHAWIQWKHRKTCAMSKTDLPQRHSRSCVQMKIRLHPSVILQRWIIC